MSNKGIYTLAGIMTLAIAGIIAIQVFWIRNALELSEQNFRAQVQDALKRVALRLEDDETVKYLEERHIILTKEESEGDADAFELSEKRWIRHDIEIEEHTEIRDSAGNRSIMVFAGDSATEKIQKREVRKIIAKDTEDVIQVNIEAEGEPGEKANILAKRIMMTLRTGERDLEERINPEKLDSIIQTELQTEGIRLTYNFKVWEGEEANTSGQVVVPAEKASFAHKVQLFPNDLIQQQNFLGLAFPYKLPYTLRSVWGMALLSFLLTAVILMGFALTVRTIFRQKKLSEMKNDFIHNMTHEFKTPLATISIAADALRHEAVRSDADKTQHYTDIIQAENRRMHEQVEQVLQAAQLDRKELALNRHETDLHALVQTAVNSIRLQIEEREGSLALELNAIDHRIRGDKVHLGGMIRNLLDNANKYSPGTPEIRLTTQNSDGGFLLSVTDKGEGISKANKPRIFEKFFRVPKGDLHDVKGSGLGLTYVKAIAEAHGGHVSVTSQAGAGSVFHVWLPVETA